MQIEGTLIVELFYSQKNNFRICKIQTETDSLTISGYFDNLEKNVPYIFEGEYVIHKKYGRQFNVSSVKVNASNKEGIIAYFSSDLFNGIGVSMAKKIYDLLGDEAVDIILENKNILLEIMSEKKADIIYNALVSNVGLNKLIIDMNNLGITSKEAIKLYNYYGSQVMEVIRNNPYELMNVEGIGFKKCDDIAILLGFEETSEFRIEAIIISILRKYTIQNGNSYLYLEEILDITLKYLNYRVTSEYLLGIIDSLIKENKIVFDEYYYLKEVYYAEVYLANKIKKMNKTYKISDDILNRVIDNAEINLFKEFDDEQKSAIKNALKNQVSIISGGPGVGKTTIINAIILSLKELYKIDLSKNDLMIMAPTGKASQKMMETLNIKASTIHRALGYTEDGDFEYNEDNHLPAKFIIVDEVSMLDIFIANALLSALDEDTRIVFVGDCNQLPSVNVGNVLSDLINSNLFCVTYLKTNHRQKLGSRIINLSEMVLNGKIDYSVFNDELRRIVINPNDLYRYLKNEIDLYLNQGYKFNEIVVLAPLYRSFIGINEINKFMQNEYNKNINYIEYNDIIFKCGDRVIQLKNNMDKNISNGDTGIIKVIDNEKSVKAYVDFDGKLVEYTYEELNELNLAYCLSIHKAQGSEYKVVILPMFRGYSIMLKRKLFYTAITRAKEKLSILCDMDSLDIAATNMDDERRSTLNERFDLDYIYIDGFKFLKNDCDDLTPYDFLDKDII